MVHASQKCQKSRLFESQMFLDYLNTRPVWFSDTLRIALWDVYRFQCTVRVRNMYELQTRTPRLVLDTWDKPRQLYFLCALLYKGLYYTSARLHDHCLKTLCPSVRISGIYCYLNYQSSIFFISFVMQYQISHAS